MSEMPLLLTHDVAQLAGVTTAAVRVAREAGRITPAAETVSGVALYSEAEARRYAALAAATRARRMGRAREARERATAGA